MTDLWLALQDHRPILCPAVLDMAAYKSDGTYSMVPTVYAKAFKDKFRHYTTTTRCGHYTTTTRSDASSDWVEQNDAELQLCKQPFAASSSVVTKDVVSQS